MSIKTELNDFRFRVKERICAILTDCYMADNGEMPNWGNDEEIVVDGFIEAFNDERISDLGWLGKF